MSSLVSDGYASRISCSVDPKARLSTIRETQIRVPLMQGFPWQTLGSIEMRSFQSFIFQSFFGQSPLLPWIQFGSLSRQSPSPLLLPLGKSDREGLVMPFGYRRKSALVRSAGSDEGKTFYGEPLPGPPATQGTSQEVAGQG